MDKKYLFKSARLGFRNWLEDDWSKMAEINADTAVMEFFPRTQTKKDTRNFIERMRQQYDAKGFCYFAVDKLENGTLIGFIGISEQYYESSFTPCIDIGWRIDKKEWNQGFATEGAQRCLAFAENDLKLDRIYSIASVINLKSIHIMEKLGMEKVQTFEHALLLNDNRLKRCVLYQKVFK